MVLGLRFRSALRILPTFSSAGSSATQYQPLIAEPTVSAFSTSLLNSR